jgi:hypothetical protein
LGFAAVTCSKQSLSQRIPTSFDRRKALNGKKTHHPTRTIAQGNKLYSHMELSHPHLIRVNFGNRQQSGQICDLGIRREKGF